MNKIQKIEWLETNRKEVVDKINEIITILNSKALSDKEECNHNWVGFSAMECSKCGKRDEESKQEDLRSQDDKDCEEFFARGKQSTSLKEEIAKLMIKENEIGRSVTVNWFNFTAEKITNLIQSHLVKEVKYKPIGFECDEYNQGYNEGMRDIIKIINNIK